MENMEFLWKYAFILSLSIHQVLLAMDFLFPNVHLSVEVQVTQVTYTKMDLSIHLLTRTY